tara:strand:- start:1449 stop:2492 length:1044 start_codon:yes stop_codon:yes gene_type:complete
MKISNRKIDINHPPFLIAEMSGNHNKSINRALKIVSEAAKNGADIIKLQTFKPETLTIDSNKKDFLINDKKSLWNGKKLYDLYKETHTPWEWHKPIIDEAKKHNLLWFSSPFDETAVDFLEDLNIPAYKVASFENTDFNLIKKIASTKKPMIISTGMASLNDLKLLIECIKDYNINDFALLKCTSSYPAPPNDANILTIPDMRNKFNCEIGLSDHTLGIGVALTAVAHGASIIEKHLTLKRSEGGLDSAFSIEPNELYYLRNETEKSWLALGKVFYGPTKSELNSLKYKRSIYVTDDVKVGDVLTINNVRVIRPGYGIEPIHFDKILGKKFKKNLEKGTPLSWELIE